MVLIGLLLIDVVCLVLGLVLASPAWLVGSLAASAAAAWVLWWGRDFAAQRSASADGSATGTATPTETLTEADTETETSRVEVGVGAVTGEAGGSAELDYARRDADPGTDLPGSDPTSETTSDLMTDPTAVSGATSQPGAPGDGSVWVIDGRPNYHTAHCGVLLGAHGEQIPHSQAVEDGFTPCTLCDPDSQPSEPGAFVPPAGTGGEESAAAEPATTSPLVWVVDGWPHYHDAECRVLTASGTPEAVPFGQAVDDGFTPCPACRGTSDEAPESETVGGSLFEPSEGASTGTDVVETNVVEIESVEIESVEIDVVEAEPAGSGPVEPATDRPETAAAESESEPESEPAPEPVAVAAEPEPGADTEPEPEPEPEPETADDAAAPDDEPASAATSEEPHPVRAVASLPKVWVVTGRPRYHLAECIIVAEQGPSALRLDQAVEDGFKPCSLCEPPTL